MMPTLVLIDTPACVVRLRVDRDRSTQAVTGARISIFADDGAHHADLSPQDVIQVTEALCPPEPPGNA